MVDYAAMTLSQPREGHASEDDDEDSGGAKRSSGGAAKGRGSGGGGAEPTSGGGVGSGSASSSSGKKPRGRPPGSKNKPKPPVVITRESKSAMHPVLLELSAGCDVLESVSAFATRRRLGVSILSGSGTVANVALHHPTSPAATITLHGRFDILSLSGTFLPPPNPPPCSSSSTASIVPQACMTKAPFTISLAGSQGQVIGGTVAGALTAAGPVVLMAASFTNPEFHRLPEPDDEETRDEDVKPVAMGEAAPVYSVAESNPLVGPQLTHEMVLWAMPASSRAPSHHAHPPSHY